MAPIMTTAIGVTAQALDDPDLIQLLKALKSLTLVDSEESLRELTDLLGPYKNEWLFEETVDLHCWIHPLNVMDSALTWILKNFSNNLLLIPPFAQQQQSVAEKDDPTSFATLEQLQSCSTELLEGLVAILQFSTVLLRNATSKHLYSSIPALSDLLAAADDGVSDGALAVLTALSLPPALHKQQVPEHPSQTSQLHLASTGTTGAHGGSNNLFIDVHDRLMATSRAWGTRATGMGLFVTVTADDSIYGQGELPPSMGEVNFSYYCGADKQKDVETTLQEITLTLPEILVADAFASSPDYSTASSNKNSGDETEKTSLTKQTASKKRRKVAARVLDDTKTPQQRKEVKSTAELFFLAVEKAGGIHKIPADRWFPLLADVRLARSFHSQATRCAAVCRRLRALISILHAHPSHEVMSGYFQAQPELCVEIVDLLRPIVTSANVSATTSLTSEAISAETQVASFRQDAVTNLVSDSIQGVPFEVRMLAVEALTALVSRRESSSGLLSGSPRLSSVLIDLGVGKGQYLGLLPTLIRYSLAALVPEARNTLDSFIPDRARVESVTGAPEDATSRAINVGLAFVEATMAPSIPRNIEVERGLLFIDNVLTLAASVVGTPSGTSALVDCGLIPALLRTVSMRPGDILEGLLSHHKSSFSPRELHRVNALLRFIIAQCVQILEGTFITHNNALTAFHDLQGVEILTTRLSQEIESATTRLPNETNEQGTSEMMDIEHSADAEGDVQMGGTMPEKPTNKPLIRSSQQILLFSIVTCLTVVFHHESSNTTASPTGGAQLRKKELTGALLEILNNVDCYGGQLASLIATLLSDIMNGDPHVVHYVHQSGIAKSFLDLVVGRSTVDSDGKEIFEPLLPPVHELITAVTNVISALALTEDGAKVVKSRNPFPSLLRILYHPDYAMPRSRCLLNDVTGMIGNGLDEIIRHVDELKPLVLSAVADALNRLADDAECLLQREEKILQFGQPTELQLGELEDGRSCLIQYVLNFGQILEQIFQNDDNCEPFVEAGGLDAILRLFPLSMPPCVQFLSFVSCLSSPSVSSLHHSTTEETLSGALKYIEKNYSSVKLIQKLIGITTNLLDELDKWEGELRSKESGLFNLEAFPQDPMCKLVGASDDRLRLISRFLLQVTRVQWITGLLANAIKAACHRSGDTGSGWSLVEREWKSALSSDKFEGLVDRLAAFHRMSLLEVCRARTEGSYEFLERQRLSERSSRLRYRLRVVCTEGAVLRDGIEIDSCANVGSLEMGDIVDAFDRCINSCGILRYRTSKGWVSEMTRGHGREPIAEVISVWESADEEHMSIEPKVEKRRIEAGLPDIRSVAVSVLARGQMSYIEFFVALSKLVIQGIRNLTLPAAFEKGDAGSYVASMLRLLAVNVKQNLSHRDVAETVNTFLDGVSVDHLRISISGAAMYLGNVLNQLHMCLFDDKRERRMVNFPLLVYLVSSDTNSRVDADSHDSTSVSKYNGTVGFFDAVRFIFKHGLSDFSHRANSLGTVESAEPTFQRVGRSVAASYPPLIALLRKLLSTPLSSSPAASIMSRMNWKDVSLLLSKQELGLAFGGNPNNEDFFQPESLVADQMFSLSEVATEVWNDVRLLHAPPFLIYPIASLIGDIVMVLEDLSKKKAGKNHAKPGDRMLLSDLMRQRQEETAVETNAEEQFEASDDSITRLMEMGFSREHALDALESTRSNRVETAMEYALANDPPSPSTIERRREEREQQDRRRNVLEEAVDRHTNAEAESHEISHPGEVVAMDVDHLPSGETEGKGLDKSAVTNNHAKKELDMWIETIPNVSISLLSSMPNPSQIRALKASGRSNAKAIREGDGDGESEALTVVLCSFVLDMCQKFPENRFRVVESLLAQLKSKLSIVPDNAELSFHVSENSEASVAALIHAAVLITRALPKARPYVLKQGMVRALVSCVQNCLANTANDSLPIWLAPCLLFLDVMSQPTAAFSDEEIVKSIAENSPDEEFCQVQTEHAEQVAYLSEMCARWFNPSKQKMAKETQPVDGQLDTACVSANSNETKAEPIVKPDFSHVPAFFPLVPADVSGSCLEFCLAIIGKARQMYVSPGVMQSVFLLLVRLLQTPKTAGMCLQMGVAEAVLTLPKESTFAGNTGLTTLVFRSIMDDESSLLAAMEAEIRCTVSKLHTKNGVGTNDETPHVSLVTFMEAVTPLLHRNPATFFKAMVLSVVVESPTKKDEVTQVALLSPAERLRRAESLAENVVSPSNHFPSSHSAGEESVQVKRTPLSQKSKRKPTNRGSRRDSHSGKKGRKDKSDDAKSAVVESPALHITGLIIHSIMSSCNDSVSDVSEGKFLSTGSMLEILTDLVLAVPACASAVHNYRPHRSKEKWRKIVFNGSLHHALSQCPPPPKSFVTFLLHSLLPQDRWTIRNDPQVWSRRKDLTSEDIAIVEAKKRKASLAMRIAQNSGRLLVALAVRPGEGRRRVIADLVFAMSGCRLGHGTSLSLHSSTSQGLDATQPTHPHTVETNSSDLHAIHAWAEVCLGMAAPRSNGKNLDGMASLSIDNVRLMLEHGIVHALLYCLHRVSLFHPMASSTYCALLVPLEIFTRPNVADAVKNLIKKEKQPKDTDMKDTRVSLPSDPHEEPMAREEEQTQADDAQQNHAERDAIAFELLVDADENAMDEDGVLEEVPDEEIGTEDSSDDDSGDDDEDEDETSESDEDEMDEDEGSEVEDSEEGSGDEVEEEEGDWDMGYSNSFAVEGQDYEADEEEVTDQIDENIDEGWTRVETNPFTRMLMGERNGVGGFAINTNASAGQARGFIDAAEAMIGTLLQNGEISGDALAEIESTLGIRIMQAGRRAPGTWRTVNDDGNFADARNSRIVSAEGNRQVERAGQVEALGTLPHVHQRIPEVGYSSLGRSGYRGNLSCIDSSCMEYVFGGPSFTGGIRNYDVFTPVNDDPDTIDEVTLSQLDLHLFPGGPVSVASNRALHTLHPLLGPVELPPMSSLVSDLLPNGIRATRQSQATTQRTGVWTSASFSPIGGYLTATSGANIMRSNRINGTGGVLVSRYPTASRIFAGPNGWTDDGLSGDVAVAEFRRAIEGALDHSVRSTLDLNEQLRNTEGTVAQSNDEATSGDGIPTAEMVESGDSAVSLSVPASSARSESETPLNSVQQSESSRSEGDGVASTLVAGLRLSSENGSIDNPTNSSGLGAPSEQRSESEQATVVQAAQSNASVDGEVDTDVSDVAVPNVESAENEMPTDGHGTDGEGSPPDANPSSDDLVCPPDVALDVFNSLPLEMQQDCVNQYRATQELAAQLHGSSLDPEVLAALPEEMRREVIEQERQERRMREQEQAQADPALAEEMDPASFIASLSPELREDILITADDAFLNSLPPGIIAEAQILRERASVQHRRLYDAALGGSASRENPNAGVTADMTTQAVLNADSTGIARRRQRSRKMKVEMNRTEVVFLPEHLFSPFSMTDLKAIFRLMYLLSPIQPSRLLQKFLLNLCANPGIREVVSTTFVKLLHEDGAGALRAIESFATSYEKSDTWRPSTDATFSNPSDFPPSMLLGAAPEVPEPDVFHGSGAATLIRRRHASGTAASLAANLPKGASSSNGAHSIPPAVAARIVDTLLQLCKSPRFCFHVLTDPVIEESDITEKSTCFERLLELLDMPMYLNSSGNLDQLLTLLEASVAPLSHVSKQGDDEVEVSQRDIDLAAASSKEYVDIPRIVVSQSRLQLLCSILRMETCRDTAFAKVNTIVRRLCRVEMNRGYVLAELASVAHALGADAIRDLRALRIRMEGAVSHHQGRQIQESQHAESMDTPPTKHTSGLASSISSSVTLSTSTSEMKLLRVLQTLQALCNDGVDDHSKKNDSSAIVTEELGHLLRQMQFDDLWDELSSCLKVVQVLEGVKTYEQEEQKASEDMDTNDEGSTDDTAGKTKQLRNSAAGLLTRFLPSIEAFFVANASATRSVPDDKENQSGDDLALENLVGGQRMIEFVTTNRVLLNAIVRNNAALLDKGLRALVQVPRCRVLLDFDVKRQWFKTQVRRLRHQASRRHGSLRLHIRRKHVFEDAYHQLQPRNSDEMRGRLHVTFRNEEGVDAGGLSREFFGILAKEMFNPNYALFTSTEDGCTFQPNPNSIINPDHLSYFRFVGRVVGKAVADGFLLDAHFTRSLYKHLLGMQPTHHDMEAIDPDYYRNLKTILEYNLSDIGLDLTFSIEDHSFGRNQLIDLLPNGRSIAVTEENKEQYVRLVCQHRMTTSIESQIKSFQAGFYELVSRELIAIFTPRELELLISGLPDIDVHDLKKNTDYAGWRPVDKEIEWFWNILFSLSRNEKAAFLQFVTGSSKVPLAGFSELQGMRGNQKFAIHKVGGAKGALMSAHTCFNSLDLPVYDSEEEMREKLLYAINEGGGAFLFA